MNTVNSVVLSCVDSLGALSGISLLDKWGIRPIALSGLFTASELLIREIADSISIPIFNIDELLEGAVVPILKGQGAYLTALAADRA